MIVITRRSARLPPPMRFFVLCHVCLACLASGACSRAPSEPPPSPEVTHAAPAAGSASGAAGASSAHGASGAPTTSGAPGAGIVWDDPPRWKRRAPSTPMRKAEYLVPRAGKDADDAECFVITFGNGQGGSIDDNIERWVKQLQPTTSPVERTKRTAHGWSVTRVEVAGTYTPMQMPGAPS